MDLSLLLRFLMMRMEIIEIMAMFNSKRQKVQTSCSKKDQPLKSTGQKFQLPDIYQRVVVKVGFFVIFLKKIHHNIFYYINLIFIFFQDERKNNLYLKNIPQKKEEQNREQYEKYIKDTIVEESKVDPTKVKSILVQEDKNR